MQLTVAYKQISTLEARPALVAIMVATGYLPYPGQSHLNHKVKLISRLEKRSGIDQVRQSIDFIPLVKLDAITLVAEAAFFCLVEGGLFRCAVSMRFHADLRKEPHESADH